MRKCTYFYATPSDFHGLMDLVEAEEMFLYACHRDIRSPDVELYRTARKIPDLLHLFPGHYVHDVYLVPPGTEVKAAPYQHVSGTRYALRPPQLSSAVVIQLGGEHPDGPLVQSRFWAHGAAPETLQLENMLFRTIRRRFRNVKGPKVGPEAYDQMQAGRRLTWNMQAPAGADLRAD